MLKNFDICNNYTFETCIFREIRDLLWSEETAFLRLVFKRVTGRTPPPPVPSYVHSLQLPSTPNQYPARNPRPESFQKRYFSYF